MIKFLIVYDDNVNKQIIFTIIHRHSAFTFFLSWILFSKYFAKTMIDPSEVQMSSRIILFIGYFVISKIDYSRSEFLLSFSRKYRASSKSDLKTFVR